jgi:hypothetical protein
MPKSATTQALCKTQKTRQKFLFLMNFYSHILYFSLGISGSVINIGLIDLNI